MASSKHLRQIFQFAKIGNEDAFKKVAEEIIQEEREKQHHLLANDLEEILYGKVSKVLPFQILKEEIPLDKEKNLPLLTVSTASKSLNDIVLFEQNLNVIERILLESRKVEVLKSYGLKPIDKILFYGPPGCGKTVTAEAIAFELELPFVVIRLDSIVSSFLGETSSNLRRVFDFINKNRMVVLFDEFDALGRERSDSSEHGEIKRVVNALLQMFDSYKGNSILIAATNHESDLDSAVWRRFEEVLIFNLPDNNQIKRWSCPLKLEYKKRG
ncbi:MAG: ATP-binding protein [Leptospiraceae bacterium]|nr:ATP-binding protein [Leptospiraceae bacterium]MCK6382691.1 ATP-binding protein [Leptospiraceae bacterium]NUM43031.1 ATP-binding protein [Leptospiraceae bacterium]